jgi:Na+-driven multidrug efflux pump
MGIQYSITAIGTLVVQAAINGFGSAAVAGVTAAQKLNSFFACPVEALGATMSAYVAQNIGAGRIDRVRKGLRDACLCGFAVSAVIFVIVALTGKQLALFFLDEVNEQVVAYSYQFLFTTSAAYCLLVLVNTVRFSIQGMGFSVFAIMSGVMEMIARVLVGTVLVSLVGFTGICFSHVLAWIFADSFLIPAFLYCSRKLERQIGARARETA